jgi:hypothetical protein
MPSPRDTRDQHSPPIQLSLDIFFVSVRQALFAEHCSSAASHLTPLLLSPSIHNVHYKLHTFSLFSEANREAKGDILLLLFVPFTPFPPSHLSHPSPHPSSVTSSPTITYKPPFPIFFLYCRPDLVPSLRKYLKTQHLELSTVSHFVRIPHPFCPNCLPDQSLQQMTPRNTVTFATHFCAILTLFHHRAGY